MDTNNKFEWFLESILGASISGFYASIMPELIHGLAVLITSVLSTILIHYTRKFLTKK